MAFCRTAPRKKPGHFPWLLAVAWMSIGIPFPSAHANGLIDGIRHRGELRCGVSEGIAGFSERDAAGRWNGFNVDFCRAVAAALFGDGEKVRFVSLKASERFPALQSRRIDLLMRNTTWTFVREAAFGVQFPAILFYDGQAFMVPKAANIEGVSGLDGATVCVEKGTTHLADLLEYSRGKGIRMTPLVIDSALEVRTALFSGRCQAYTSDSSQLSATRLHATVESGGPEAFVILPERISRQPMAPAVLDDDVQWASLVRWVVFTLILAEEQGITRDNVASKWPLMKQRKLEAWKLAGGKETSYGQLVGASDDMALNVIGAVGNYGEMYERNVGRDSRLKIERGLNRLWSDGGLLYAPPVD